MRAASTRQFALSIAAALVGTAAQDTLTRGASRFLLLDTRSSEWCAYTEHGRWRADVEAVNSPVVATVAYSNRRHPTVITVTEESESGDWMVDDIYSLSPSGQVQTLKRTISMLPGDLQIEQWYAFKEGKPVMQSAVQRSLSQHKPRTMKSAWLPDVPIVSDIRRFPFYGLVDHEIVGGRMCLRASQ